MTLTAQIGLALDGDAHDAEDRPMGVNQGDIDREFAIAIDEFLGAIQRVDQPVTAPLTTFFKRRQPVLFRDDRYTGRQFRQPGHDASMRGEVGLCQGRFVTLLLNVEIRSVDFKDCLTRVSREGNGRFNQLCEVHPVIRAPSGARSIKQ